MKLGEYIARFKKDNGRLPRIGFLGLGASTLALLSDIPRYPVSIRSSSATAISLPEELNCETLICGIDALSGIFEDVLFLSPSARRDKSELIEAKIRGTLLLSDAELFFMENERPIYAVTGSDGKSTTATLIHKLLCEGGGDAELLGNIGTPFALSKKGCSAVAELSSFQLSYLTAHFRSATVTSITPNHLDWHKSLDEYVAAKLSVFASAERKVASPDTSITRALISEIAPDVIYSVRYPDKELRALAPNAQVLSLGEDAILLNRKPLLALSDCKRREIHNIHNLMGAIGATLGECSAEEITNVAREFNGLEHRLEHFFSYRGIDFINSSIDTTPSRAAASLRSLDRRVHLLMGGRGKNLPLSECMGELWQYAARISLYGEVAEEYYGEIVESGLADEIKVTTFSSFDDALEDALIGLSHGDALLLSPAATGYGEFRSFAERGRHFKEYIRGKYNNCP